MLFKKIEMHGFKSFAEPITIEFNQGITGIVGPNGSGKSNISDAIRWVLGEQSPKMLRGGKMEEVIFNGTDSRKSRGMAEVTLVIDNSDESLPIDYGEVAITRRMFRSGESEYHINGNQCRLRDIRELIMDTGIGVDGYSLIGQGKIADIISNKTESRREIFEEAAGIVAYRTKKEEAERKLASTTLNMNRVQDIIGEIEGRIDGLKEDSEKAKEFLELKKKHKELEINIILKNVEALEVKNEYAREDLAVITANLESLNAEREKLEEKIGKGNARNEELEELSAKAQQTLIEAIDALNAIMNKAEVDKERILAIGRSEEQLNSELVELKDRKDRERAASEEILKQKQEIQAECESAEAELEKKTAEYSEVTEAMNSLAQEADGLRNRVYALSSDIATSESEIAGLKMLTENLSRRKETLNSEKDAGEDTNRETLDSLNTARKEAENLLSEIEIKKSERERTSSDLQQAQESEKKLNEELESLNVSLGKMTARKKTIEEMENNYEGYNYAVKHVMKSGITGIHGVVAELIDVPQGYETAIETALGQSLQNIVCEDDSSAKRAIKSLKENKAGRMTFLPMTSIRGREEPDPKLSGETGFIGFAPECIKYDEKYSEIISYLMGKVVIVDNMDSAIRISRKTRGEIIVTMEGEIINARGAITGGRHKNRSANILDRRAEIGKLGRDIERDEKRREECKGEVAALRNRIESLQELMDEKALEIRSLEQDSMLKSNEIKIAENALTEIKNSAGRMERELESIDQEREKSDKRIQDIEKNIEEMKAASAEAEKLCEEKTAEHDSHKAEYDRLTEEITAARITVTSCSEQKAHAEELYGRVESSIAQIEGDIEARQLKLTELAEEKEEISAGGPGEGVSLEDQENAKAEAEKNLNSINEEKSALTASLGDMNGERDSLAGRIETLKNQKYDLDLRKARNETQLETYKDKLWEDFEVSYVQALEFKSEEFVLSRAVKDNRQIKNRMKELGEVNIGAIEEYETVSERYKFLTDERADVQAAMDDLNGIISEMDKTIRTRFKGSFNQIVVNFENQFRQLFGGGHAELRLSDESDPLESNIDIVAQPPGKKLQNINLLSGGEKTLTAIALMFAVLEAKPTPFCILDEVEAALDDANIDRFIKCLRQFEGIQFTLVTHQKATMEQADVLYGVTMPEKGVSKVLSLSLEDDLSRYNS